MWPGATGISTRSQGTLGALVLASEKVWRFWKKLFEGVLERARRWPRALRCRIPIKLRGVQWVELRRKTGAREAGLEGAWS